MPLSKEWISPRIEFFFLLAVAAFVLALALTLYWINFPDSLSNEHKRWAEFGSYVGGTLGASFAFLAFIVLLRTLHVNKKELQETRKVLGAQNSLIQQQSFESTFMQLVKEVGHETLQANKYLRSMEPQLQTRTNIENTLIFHLQSNIEIRELQKKILYHITEERSEHFEKYLKLLTLVTKLLAEKHGSGVSKKIHVEIFLNKLDDDLIFILIAKIIASGELKLTESVFETLKIISFIEFEDSKSRLTNFYEKLKNNNNLDK